MPPDPDRKQGLKGPLTPPAGRTQRAPAPAQASATPAPTGWDAAGADAAPHAGIRSRRRALLGSALALGGVLAAAGPARAAAAEEAGADVPMPSEHLALDLVLRPSNDRPGTYALTVRVRDLDAGEALIMAPTLLLPQRKPALMDLGDGRQWQLRIEVQVDEPRGLATADLRYTRLGRSVFQHRIRMGLGD